MNRLAVRAVVVVCFAVLWVIPASATTAARPPTWLMGRSPVLAVKAAQLDPSQASPSVRALLAAAAEAPKARPAPVAAASGRGGHVFNRDTLGLPQDEESVSVCERDPRLLISGTNDFRGVLDPAGDFTGWYFSRDAGRTITKEGLLPPVTVAGKETPSGGDPAFVADDRCVMYAATLLVADNSGVGVYRTTPGTLARCPQGKAPDTLTQPACWPKRRNLATAAPGHFLDKEWLQVGRSGRAGRVVWIAWSDLSQFRQAQGEAAEHRGVVEAVRCNETLTRCTTPIVLSRGQRVAEYPDITIGPDGRTYITWTEFLGGSFTGPAERAWMAVAQPGSTRFSAPRLVIGRDDLVLRGHPLGKIHSNDFRLGGNFTVNTVRMVNGRPRVYMLWTHCRAELIDAVCEEPATQLTMSDDQGQTWTRPRAISAGGDNYFPTIDVDQTTGNVVAAWYTSRFDRIFHNRQDVEMVTLAGSGKVKHRQRITRVSNEPEADPLLQGLFIGDYIEVSASHGRAWIGYNANLRHQKLLGFGFAEPQQDNYLARVRE